MNSYISNRVLTPEGHIIRQIREYLRMKGWLVIRMQQGPLCHKGIADLYCRHSVHGEVWIEVKTKTGRQSMWQKQFQDDIASHGGRYFLARSLDDVLKL